MKTFKELMAEVAQPISKGEKAFVAAHKIDHKNLVPGVTDQDHIFNGSAQRLDPSTASYHDRDDVKAYDAGLKVEEEVEQIDEVSAGAVNKYISKAKTSLKDLQKKGDERKAYTRDDSIRMATRKLDGGNAKVMAKEDVEQVDEAEAKTASGTKWSKIPGDKEHKVSVTVHSNGRKHVFTGTHSYVAKKLKDEHGMSMHDVKFKNASDMKEDIELDEKTLTSAEMKKREDVVKAIKREHPKMDKSMMYAIATKTAKRVAEEYVVEDEDEMDYEGEMAKAELNAICDKAGILADMLENDTQLEAWLQSKITKAKYMIDSVYDYMMYSNKGDREENEMESPYSQSGAMADNYSSFLNRMGEETELDEAAEKQYIEVTNKHTGAVKHIEVHPTKAYAALNQYRDKNNTARIVSKKPSVKEEMELDEARRGRPRKDGSTSGEEEGGREHIIVQLRKANNLRGERHTEFNDNSKHKLPLQHVKKALDMHSNMKPQQKAEFEARLAKSHASFHDAVSGKPAEKPKAKISLGGMKKEEVDPTSRRSDRGDLKAAVITNKAGKLEVIKRQAARKELKVDADMQKEAVDMNTANVKKIVKHDCAKHVEHAEWGNGVCIPEQHTIVETAEGEGYVSHYDVMFEHGIEQNVPVESLNVVVSESHEHSGRKMSEALKGDQHKIDANKNGKVDAHDFKILRGKTSKYTIKLEPKKARPAFKEEIEQVDEGGKYNWDKAHKHGLTDTLGNRMLNKKPLPKAGPSKAQLAILAAKANLVGKGGKIKEEAEIEESVKANMAQDSVNKLQKDPLASKEKITLPPTQGNEPVGGEGEIATGAGKYSIAEDTLNKLYDSLSEENKEVFIQMYETEEGKLELLAFAEEQGIE